MNTYLNNARDNLIDLRQRLSGMFSNWSGGRNRGGQPRGGGIGGPRHIPQPPQPPVPHQNIDIPPPEQQQQEAEQPQLREEERIPQRNGGVKRKRQEVKNNPDERPAKRARHGHATLPTRVMDWLWSQKAFEEFYFDQIAESLGLSASEKGDLASSVLPQLLQNDMIKTKLCLVQIEDHEPPVEVNVYWHEKPMMNEISSPDSIINNRTASSSSSNQRQQRPKPKRNDHSLLTSVREPVERVCLHLGCRGMTSEYRNVSNPGQVYCERCYELKKKEGSLPEGVDFQFFVQGNEINFIEDDEDEDEDDNEEKEDERRVKKTRRKKSEDKELDSSTNISVRITGPANELENIFISTKKSGEENVQISTPTTAMTTIPSDHQLPHQNQVNLDEEQRKRMQMLEEQEREREMEELKEKHKQELEEVEKRKKQEIEDLRRKREEEEEKRKREEERKRKERLRQVREDQQARQARIYRILFYCLLVTVVLFIVFGITPGRGRYGSRGMIDGQYPELSDRSHLFFKEVQQKALGSSEIPEWTKINTEINKEFAPYINKLSYSEQNSILNEAVQWANKGYDVEEILVHVRESIDQFITHNPDSEAL